jgi:hypothetical protein
MSDQDTVTGCAKLVNCCGGGDLYTRGYMDKLLLWSQHIVPVTAAPSRVTLFPQGTFSV